MAHRRYYSLDILVLHKDDEFETHTGDGNEMKTNVQKNPIHPRCYSSCIDNPLEIKTGYNNWQ